MSKIQGNGNSPVPASSHVTITIKTPNDSVDRHAESEQIVISNPIEISSESFPDRVAPSVVSGLITGLLVGVIMFVITNSKEQTLQELQNSWANTQQNRQNVWSINQSRIQNEWEATQAINQNNWEYSQRVLNQQWSDRLTKSQMLTQSMENYVSALIAFEGRVIHLVGMGPEKAGEKEQDELRESVSVYGDLYLSLAAAKYHLVNAMRSAGLEEHTGLFDRIFFNVLAESEFENGKPAYFEIDEDVKKLEDYINMKLLSDTSGGKSELENQLSTEQVAIMDEIVRDWGDGEDNIAPKFSIKAHGGIIHFISAHDFGAVRKKQKLFNNHIKAAFSHHREIDLPIIYKEILGLTNNKLEVGENPNPSD